MKMGPGYVRIRNIMRLTLNLHLANKKAPIDHSIKTANEKLIIVYKIENYIYVVVFMCVFFAVRRLKHLFLRLMIIKTFPKILFSQ